jgi:hypothetical protein
LLGWSCSTINSYNFMFSFTKFELEYQFEIS